MDLSAALTTHLHVLSRSVGTDDAATEVSLNALNAALEQAVPSYLGLQLSLVDHGHPVVLTAFGPVARSVAPATSLRLSLSLIAAGDVDPASAVTFFAGTPGGFVDLAADLTYALRPEGPSAHNFPTRAVTRPDPRPGISIDDDVRPTTLVSGLVGVAELSTINRAIGIMIGDGHEDVDAQAELGRLADAAGVSVLASATRLVRGHA